MEGARVANAIGTYLHGSLLPKNPAVTDFLIGKALARRYGEHETLAPLDDTLEDGGAGSGERDHAEGRRAKGCGDACGGCCGGRREGVAGLD